MPWAKFDDRVITHPVINSLTDRAFRLWVNSIIYCCKHKTNGEITYYILSLLSPKQRLKKVINELIKKGLFIKTEDNINLISKRYQNDIKLIIKGYEKYQPTKENKKEKTTWHGSCSPEPEPEPIYNYISENHAKPLKKLLDFINFVGKVYSIDKKKIRSSELMLISKLLPITEFEVIKIKEGIEYTKPEKIVPYIIGTLRGLRNDQ